MELLTSSLGEDKHYRQRKRSKKISALVGWLEGRIANVIEGFVCNVGTMKNAGSELCAARLGLQRASKWGFKQVMLEVDADVSLELVKGLTTSRGKLIQDCCNFINKEYTYHECNGRVNYLSRLVAGQHDREFIFLPTANPSPVKAKCCIRMPLYWLFIGFSSILF